jgi:GNAT superfamily N-acetyltransferase
VVTSAVEIRVATLDHASALCGVLARAFENDPMIRWPLRPDVTQEELVRAFAPLVEGYTRIGALLEAGDAAGVAVWVPPGRMADVHRIWDEATVPSVELSDDHGERYNAMWDWVGARFPSEPCWFLEFVGVEPSLQGRGIGTALIRHGLARADAEGVPAFLETGIEGNARLYERLGFHTVEDGDAPRGGPHIWFMLRDPASDG